jgi:hypothetical protein
MTSGGIPSQNSAGPGGSDLESGTAFDSGHHDPHSAFRKLPADGGYDAGDGFQFVEPQLNSTTAPSGGSASDSYMQQQQEDALRRRRSSASYASDRYDRPDRYDRGYRDQPTYDRPRRRVADVPYRNRSEADLANRKSGYDSYSSDDDDSGADEKYKEPRGAVGKIKRRMSEMLEPDQEWDGEGNSQAKKWGATIAGAVIGATAARQARKDHWVPAALGAVLGGMTAREVEKMYFRHHGSKEKEDEAPWEGRDVKERSRSRSRSRRRS